MEDADFNSAVFFDCDFISSDFYWALAFSARFIECRFDTVDFRGANLTGAFFIDCQISNCDFSKDNLGSETNLSETSFINSPRKA